jgi:hypothetical protein
MTTPLSRPISTIRLPVAQNAPQSQPVYNPPVPTATRYVLPPTQAPAPVIPLDQPVDPPQSQPQSVDRCSLFDDINMTTVWLDPPSMYIKMPGGVPGLERDIPGDYEAWDYKLIIGSYQADRCRFLGDQDPLYAGRLYCDITLPPDYLNTTRWLDLYVNNCEQPIISNPSAYIFPGESVDVPVEPDKGTDGGSGSSCTSGQILEGWTLSQCNAAGYNWEWVDAYQKCICP